MRQISDSEYTAVLSRIQIRQPTSDDIQLLNTRIEVQLQDGPTVLTVVHQHIVQHAINTARLEQHIYYLNQQQSLTYCVANIIHSYDI